MLTESAAVLRTYGNRMEADGRQGRGPGQL